jgi:hypothetical protein
MELVAAGSPLQKQLENCPFNPMKTALPGGEVTAKDCVVEISEEVVEDGTSAGTARRAARGIDWRGVIVLQPADTLWICQRGQDTNARPDHV